MKMFPADIWEYPIPKIGNFSFRFLGKTLDEIHTKFSEVTLAVHYREKNAEGDYVGGPMYYIKNGLGKKWYWMASVYAILGSLTVLGTGNATQVNTITTSIDSALISYNVIDDAQISMVNLVIGIVIAALVAVVLLGGV